MRAAIRVLSLIQPQLQCVHGAIQLQRYPLCSRLLILQFGLVCMMHLYTMYTLHLGLHIFPIFSFRFDATPTRLWISMLRLCAELSPHVMDASLLVGSELGQASTVGSNMVRNTTRSILRIGMGSNSLVGVAHVVVDRVIAGVVGARVAADGAAELVAALGGRVVDLVAVAGAAALERVVQAQPVADLVGGSDAEVVLGANKLFVADLSEWSQGLTGASLPPGTDEAMMEAPSR